MKRNKGITLIALVITIIILVILAGVTISFILTDDGIINKSQKSAEEYEEQAAREKLELKLFDLKTIKVSESNYNQDEYLTKYLTDQGFVVDENIVNVNSWQFEIERNTLKIINNLGKGKINKQIKIELLEEPNENLTQAKITINVTSDKEIKTITINGEERIDFTNQNGVYTIVIDNVTENKTYTIIAKNINEEQNNKVVKASSIADNMEINSIEDWNEFVTKAQNGATFAGKTITLKNDIDLINIENFTPIPMFEGVLDGNNHIISNIKITSTSDYVGLFGLTNNAKIKNIKLSNVNISGYNKVAAAVGAARGTLEIDNVSVDGTISATGWGIGGIVGYAPQTSITIKNSNVNANISATAVVDSVCLGGLAGLLRTDNLLVSNCYFLGTITTTGTKNNWATGGLIGDVGTEAKDDVTSTTHLIEKCYVKATVTGRGNTGGFIGGITSYQKSGTYNITFNDCFVQGNVTAPEYVGGWAPVYQNLGNATVNVKMNRNYYAGKVTSINKKLYGAFTGYNSGTSVSVDYQDCYFDKTISGITTTYGEAIGKTTKEMQTSETFASWPTDIWQIEDGKYPVLK